MEPNKILSANILDLLFDNRNKEYGAYELRVTYPERIKRSMLVVFIIAGIAVGGAAIANSIKPGREGKLDYKVVTLEQVEPKKDEVIPELVKPKPEPQQTRTEIFTPPRIVNEEDLDPPPTQDDLKIAQVDVVKRDGVDDVGIADKPLPDDGKGIIDVKKPEEPVIWTSVQVPASYNGNWSKFLTQNLNSEIPVDNEAPIGRYTVIIQFVVDIEGNLSDITPVTNLGYGMEQEAVRVLKKAKGWKPGIQNGHEVKSYHKQPITFVVE